MKNWVIIIVISSIILFFLIMSFFNLWEISTFLGMLLLLLIYSIELAYIKMVKDRETEHNLSKSDIYYSWNKVNELLLKFPGGNPLEWGGGLQRRIETRTYKTNDKEKEYVAFYGMISGARSIFVNVIYCKDDESIKRFEGTYDPRVILDPFHNFNPQTAQTQNMFGHNDLRRKGLFDNMNHQKNGFEVGDEFIDKSLNDQKPSDF